MSESKTVPVEDAKILDDGRAPIILTDGYCSATAVGGVARFSFFALRTDAPTQQNVKQVVVHLATPIASMIEIHRAMGEMLKEMEKQGVFQTAKPRLDS